MCDFCKEIGTSSWESNKRLVSSDIVLNGFKFGEIYTYLYDLTDPDETDEPRVLLMTDLDVFDEEVLSEKVRVNYCPICGRNFKES